MHLSEFRKKRIYKLSQREARFALIILVGLFLAGVFLDTKFYELTR